MSLLSRPYYTLDEASAHLSGISGETVSLDDLKRLHSEGKLQILEIDLDTYQMPQKPKKSDELSDIDGAALIARTIRITKDKNRAKPIDEYRLIDIITKEEIVRFISIYKAENANINKETNNPGNLENIVANALALYKSKHQDNEPKPRVLFLFACEQAKNINGIYCVSQGALKLEDGTFCTSMQFRNGYGRIRKKYRQLVRA